MLVLFGFPKWRRAGSNRQPPACKAFVESQQTTKTGENTTVLNVVPCQHCVNCTVFRAFRAALADVNPLPLLGSVQFGGGVEERLCRLPLLATTRVHETVSCEYGGRPRAMVREWRNGAIVVRHSLGSLLHAFDQRFFGLTWELRKKADSRTPVGHPGSLTTPPSVGGKDHLQLPRILRASGRCIRCDLRRSRIDGGLATAVSWMH